MYNVNNIFENLFLARRDGFYMPAEATNDFLQPKYLQSKDYKEVLCAILAHAQKGDFSHFERILPLMVETRMADVWSTGIELLGSAAPYSIIRSWLSLFHQEIYESEKGARREYASFLLARSHGLWAVPELLKIFRACTSVEQMQGCSVHLSLLLEEHYGPVYQGVEAESVPEERENEFPPPEMMPSPSDMDAYEKLCMAKFHELEIDARKRGMDPAKVAIYEGEIFNLEHICQRLVQRINSGVKSYAIGRSRMVFEAFTGINCSRFYDGNGNVRIEEARNIVNKAINDGITRKFEPGVRYFFGHRIPD